MMEEEVVRRSIKHEESVDLLGAANLIPGPNSTESQGRSRRRWESFAPSLYWSSRANRWLQRCGDRR
jgi:hypothetical protein